MNDISVFSQWYIMLFLLGLATLPLTTIIFQSLSDKGYIFSKLLSALIISYAIFLFGTVTVLPFTTTSLLFLCAIVFFVNIALFKKLTGNKISRKLLLIWISEEIIFLFALVIWTFIRGHEPSINGLEKFMDFGFINSILRTEYFPPLDMWFPPHSINYYYFGHLVTAVLTKLSFLPSNYTYNLMVATIFALTISMSFSIGFNITRSMRNTIRKSIFTGFLCALLVSLAGNLHIIYALFSAYTPADSPVPFWELAFQPLTIFANGYWYPNATRFIPNTIHEFPLYSFVVSDLHGHVLDIPVVLTFIIFVFTLIKTKTVTFAKMLFLGFTLAIMYMTNVLDFGIYSILIVVTFGFLMIHNTKSSKDIKHTENSNDSSLLKKVILQGIKPVAVTLLSAFIFTIPFSLHFKPFASGIGILCSPNFLTARESIGPFLFEADHCQRSEWWMLLTLYGFFYFFVITFFIFLWRNQSKITYPGYSFCIILSLVSTLLITIPEFAYIKDIYPGHYRANTMFKLTYQAFIMLSIVSAIVATTVIKPKKNIFLSLAAVLLIISVLIYPRFAIYSYYNSLETYEGIDGTAYLKERYPSDYKAILWLNSNISGQPVILESQGDSYTDHARISSNTGLPTVLGWTVHEWLWRGSYDVPAPRISEVQTLYETPSADTAKQLIDKYDIQYIYIGDMEREKYPAISPDKFKQLGEMVYENEAVVIYKINTN